ncbi:MAG: hypothetical protein QNJ36_07760 [Calothrix sp. MO_167.B42]|nr:hypothetical protein [Calothrix sp. MO_167.B42]
MYCKSNQPSITPENFELPVAVQLSPDNRWVIMAELIPWSDFETEYAQNCIAGSILSYLFSSSMSHFFDSDRLTFKTVATRDCDRTYTIVMHPTLINSVDATRLVARHHLKSMEKSRFNARTPYTIFGFSCQCVN